MKCVQYFNQSVPTAINKTLEEIATSEAHTLENVDVLKPTITLRDFRHADCNYVYLDAFRRYYHVVGWSVRTNGIYTVELEVDVLMTYADKIMGTGCDIIEVEAQDAVNPNCADYAEEDIAVRIEYPIASPFTDEKDTLLVGV